MCATTQVVKSIHVIHKKYDEQVVIESKSIMLDAYGIFVDGSYVTIGSQYKYPGLMVSVELIRP